MPPFHERADGETLHGRKALTAYARVYHGWMDALAGLLDGPRARQRLPAADRARPAVVDADPGPRRRWRCWRWSGARRDVMPDDGAGGRAAAPVTWRSRAGRTPYVVADNPSTPPQVIIHPGERCTTLVRRRPRRGDGPRRAHLGQQRGRQFGDAGRHVRVDRRDQRPAAAVAADAGLTVPADSWDSPIVPLLGARGHQGRPGPVGRARPAARPAADRRPAGLVRPPRGRGGLVPGAGRPGGGSRAADAAQPPGPPVDGRGAGCRARACRGRRWRGGSPSWSASRRCRT